MMNKVLKRLLLAASLCCLVATANAVPFEDALNAEVKGDYKQALKIYRALAAQGDAAAQSRIGYMYQEGNGVTRNYQEALKWFRLAAAHDVEAKIMLGIKYERGGNGFIKDYKEALRWYSLAAEQGDARAQNYLGYMYYLGRGVPRDNVRAHMWFNLSKASGNGYDEEAMEHPEREMTPQQIEKAQEMARKCQERNFKGC